LTGAGLRGQTRDLLLLVVVGLRHRGIRLVAARGTHALVLVIDVRRRVERSLEAARAIERRGPPEAIDVAHLIRILDPAFLTDLLLDQFHREERRQVLWPDRLSGSRVKRRRQRRSQIGLDVVPAGRELALRKNVLGRHVCGFSSHRRLLPCPSFRRDGLAATSGPKSPPTVVEDFCLVKESRSSSKPGPVALATLR